jgi:hypothetical protein
MPQRSYRVDSRRLPRRRVPLQNSATGTFDIRLLAAHSRASAAYGLLKQHKMAEAIAQAQSAVKLAPDSTEAHAALGQGVPC